MKEKILHHLGFKTVKWAIENGFTNHGKYYFGIIPQRTLGVRNVDFA
jgi:hypothetical protein